MTDNLGNAYNANKFIVQFKNDVIELINSLTWEYNGSKLTMIQLIIDDYLRGTTAKRMFEDELYNLKHDLGQLEILIPVLPEPKSNFDNVLKQLSIIAVNYIDIYKNEISSTILKLIENEQNNQPVIKINQKHFIYNNQYKQLYDICYAVRKVILTKKYAVRKVILTNKKENNLTGFICKLPRETVKDIYVFMAGENYLSGYLNDFKAIFSKVSIPVENPIKWQILSKRGTKSGRGNQTALFEFLKLMLGTVSNADLKKCKNLFVDEKGYFIENDLLRPDKEKIKLFGFETQIKNILKKADQQKNQ